MNVTSTRIANRTRTWLLIAALTALLIGIGALIGGMFLYAFVALAVVMNVFGYWATPGSGTSFTPPPPPIPVVPPRFREMATLLREPHLEPFRFLIKRDSDGRHRWSLYNASGTALGRHTAGFPSELEARQDVQRVRDELANAPIIGESVSKGASTEQVEVPGAAIRSARHETGGRR